MQTASIMRAYNRAYDQLRPITISYNIFGYAPGSVLFTLGDTKVLCSVHMQPGVPHFLKGTRTGWLTAEYGMLPSATQQRTQRETALTKSNGRSIEIARLIGRALRTVINLDKIGERTIVIDCDVLQADGSTRTACISAASYALIAAQEQWLSAGLIQEPIVKEKVAAVSIGVSSGTVLLDLDYQEDSTIDADFNIVLTASGKLIEMQGTAEKKPVSWHHFESIKALAIRGIEQLFIACEMQQKQEATKASDQAIEKNIPVVQTQKSALFSLQNR